jgi:predicted ArsR family transcriptional regulator
MAYLLPDKSSTGRTARSHPSDGTTRKLLRIMQGKYAMSVFDVARNLKISERQAWRYLSSLLAQGAIYVRYRQHQIYYYSLRRTHETRKLVRSDTAGPSVGS